MQWCLSVEIGEAVKQAEAPTVHQGSSAHSLVNKGPGSGHSSSGFPEKRGTVHVTERTGRGVWMTNPDFDLGWRACWGSPGLCSRATGSLHRALTPTEVPPCRALWSSSWQSGLRGLATHPEPQLRELAGNANERAPPSQSESRGWGPGSFYNPLSVCGVSFCP